MEDNEEGCKARCSRMVTEICTWVQWFGMYVAVRAPPNPDLIRELMATIL
jgi:hypothetical protein